MTCDTCGAPHVSVFGYGRSFCRYQCLQASPQYQAETERLLQELYFAALRATRPLRAANIPNEPYEIASSAPT